MKRYLIGLIIVIIFTLALSSVTSEESIVSEPAKIPFLDNFKVPAIIPGEKGELSFSLTNRYDYPITDLKLTAEIYMYNTLEEEKNVSELSEPPVIIETNTQKIEFSYPLMNSSEKIKISFNISTSKSTLQGTYFVRMKLEFTYNGTGYKMYSIGYMSKAELDIYDLEGKPPSDCAGIIPYTSFTVREPIPLWPLYLLICIAAVFAVLAIVFYFQDKKIRKRYTLQPKVYR